MIRNANLTSFAKELKKLRIDYDDSQISCAKRVGVRPGIISTLECCRKNPTTKMAEKIATSYNLKGNTFKKFVKSAEESQISFRVNTKDMSHDTRRMLSMIINGKVSAKDMGKIMAIIKK